VRLVHLNQDRGISPKRKKGAAVHLRVMREAFARLGHTVIAIDTPDPSAALEGLEQAHREAPLDFIYERYALNAYMGSQFARQHGVPHALEVNSPLEREAGTYRAASAEAQDRLRERELFSHAKLLMAVSEGVASFCRRMGAEQERILVTPNAVDLEHFKPQEARAQVLEAIPAERFVVGFHGRLRPWHAFDKLAQTCGDLLGAGHDLHLVTLGEGDFEGPSAAYVPADRRLHIPWMDYALVPSILARFDSLPLTYAGDPDFYFSPLKLLEAMACGVVPVVPDVGDLAACVGAGRAGEVYPPGDWSALAGSIAGLIQAPSRRQAKSKAAIAMAQGRSWVDIARQVLAGLEGCKA
jgi:glycosyltransferase involved in cell wall biosynthesis